MIMTRIMLNMIIALTTMIIMVIMMTRTMVVVPTLLTLIGHKLVRSVIRALRSHHLATYIKCKVDYRWSSKYLITASAHHHIADTTPFNTANSTPALYLAPSNFCLDLCNTCLFGIKLRNLYWKLKSTLIIDKSNQQVRLTPFCPFQKFDENAKLVFFAEIWRTSTLEHIISGMA